MPFIVNLPAAVVKVKSRFGDMSISTEPSEPKDLINSLSFLAGISTEPSDSTWHSKEVEIVIS